MTAYAEQLKDPRWQKRRLQIMERANFRCEECERDDRQLHIHHRIYRKGALAWDYADGELICLCESCHAWAHKRRERLDLALSILGADEQEAVLGYAAGRAALFADSSIELTLSVSSAGFSQGLADGAGFQLTDSIRAELESISRRGDRLPRRRVLDLAADAYRRKTRKKAA